MSDQSTHVKNCIKCERPTPAAGFPPGRNICRACRNAVRRTLYAEKPAEERGVLLAKNQQWRAANREQTRAQKREYGRKNRERDAARQRIWREKNAEHITAAKRAYYLANAEKVRERARRWKATHRAEATANNARRRARLARAAGSEYTTKQHIAWRWQMWGGRCWVCGVPATATDHVLPLNDGGPHWPANLRPICTSCNSGRKKKRQPIR